MTGAQRTDLKAIWEARPDVIALQAVVHNPAQADWQSQVAQLAALADYLHHHFQPAFGHGGQEEGNALLSKYPWGAGLPQTAGARGHRPPF